MARVVGQAAAAGAVEAVVAEDVGAVAVVDENTGA